MKKFVSMFAIALLATSMLVSSCKDDDPSPSRTELLTAKSWVNTKAELSVAGQRIPYTEFWFEECSIDDILTFTKDGKYTQATGTVKCDPSEKSSVGTWKLSNNDNTITFQEDGQDDPSDVTITSLNGTTFEYKIAGISFDSNGDGKDDTTTDIYITMTAK